MQDSLDLIVTERTENHARILLAARAGSTIGDITGVVRGPYCEFTKTLTADFHFKATATGGGVEALVMEPCYWTAQMPFWYDLRLKVKTQGGTEREEILPAGIKRFNCEGRNLRLESKRIVLRGLRFDSPTENDLRIARNCETALWVTNSGEDVCQMASRLGVPLIIDLRGNDLAVNNVVRQLAWYPAVFVVLVSTDQLAELGSDSPRQTFVAIIVNAQDHEPSGKHDAIVIELSGGERPPAWAATCDKPVIAVRIDVASQIKSARAGCDRLQAELAPELSLAGYFV